ncbi:MAG TPA: patatin-like phospholipase family protein [Kofleriaceae bacterium]|nr:patatin-like phospholipase family protein [Kofleriaceae bacterium]
MSVYQHAGITILTKHDARARGERKSRIALVLAGGAITGGAFKAGGLRALDELLRPAMTLNDFDQFIGLSAGSVLASALAAGIDAEELFKITIGKSERFSQLQAYDFMRPNVREPAERIALFIQKVAEILGAYVSGREDPRTGQPFSAKQTALKLVSVLARLAPTGVFDPNGVRDYLRRQIKELGMPDDFRELQRLRGKELYVTAVDINTGTQVVFGPREHYSAVRVSDAVSASCALPVWYRTARVRNPRYREPTERRWLDLADGGVVRTANVGTALRAGADLVVVYNPFTSIRYTAPDRSLYEHGAYALASQLFRTVLGSRLDIGKEKIVVDPNVRADIVYIEPRSEDLDFFAMNPLNFWSKQRAAQHGYDSVRVALAENHEPLREVFERHGVELSGGRLLTKVVA